jgi:hypothetical protein
MKLKFLTGKRQKCSSVQVVRVSKAAVYALVFFPYLFPLSNIDDSLLGIRIFKAGKKRLKLHSVNLSRK